MAFGGDKNASGRSEVYFEFTQIGGQMRVAAIDAATGTEVIVITPVTASQIQMQTLALAKLKRRLAQGLAKNKRPAEAGPFESVLGRLEPALVPAAVAAQPHVGIFLIRPVAGVTGRDVVVRRRRNHDVLAMAVVPAVIADHCRGSDAGPEGADEDGEGEGSEHWRKT